MSRSIGDLLAQALGVSYIPEVSKYDLTPHDEFLLVWSDGVWEFISNSEAVKIVAEYGRHNIDKAAEALAQKAWDKWILNEVDLVDDITVLIHYFK